MSGEEPFGKKKNDAARITAICLGETFKPADHLGLPEADSLWGLLNKCWSVDPEARPTIETVVKEVRNELHTTWRRSLTSCSRPLISFKASWKPANNPSTIGPNTISRQKQLQ